jgi:hypothetical protein
MAFMPVVWLDLFFSGCNDWRSNVAVVVLFLAGLLPRCEPNWDGPHLWASRPPVEPDRSNNDVTYLCDEKVYRAISTAFGLFKVGRGL